MPVSARRAAAQSFLSGCCAVGSAPALGAGGPGFESPHSDHVGAKSAKLRFRGKPAAFRENCARSLAPPSPTRPASLGSCGDPIFVFPHGNATRDELTNPEAQDAHRDLSALIF